MTPGPEPQPPRARLKLLTLNTHKGFGFLNRKFVLHELREAVRATGADVVFLQEVLGSHQAHSLRHQAWPAEPQYEFLAHAIWGNFAYGRNAVYTEGHHGNAVLSKLPISRHANYDVSIGEIEKRGLLHCALALPGEAGELHVVCAHLGLREAHRRKQLERLCELVEREVPAGAPLVVAGDFNDWRRRASAVLSRCGLKEAFVEAHGAHARSFPVRHPLLTLDRIYYRGLELANPKVLSAAPWSHLSDHAALTAEALL
jgi:endonuclease/exonuclease/phosphatase family metal-dependent hydrolase